MCRPSARSFWCFSVNGRAGLRSGQTFRFIPLRMSPSSTVFFFVLACHPQIVLGRCEDPAMISRQSIGARHDITTVVRAVSLHRFLWNYVPSVRQWFILFFPVKIGFMKRDRAASERKHNEKQNQRGGHKSSESNFHCMALPIFTACWNIASLND